MAQRNSTSFIQNTLNWRLGLLCIIITFSANPSFAQFISTGKIEFERKTNQHALMDDDDRWDELAKKNTPKFITFYYDLYFNHNQLLYKQGKDPAQQQNRYWGLLDVSPVVATQLDSGKQVTQKNIYGDIFLISDSVRKMNWKINPEIRKIAGFDCRKAVSVIMDSIVVIAFYSEEIIPSGGPESFTGLPGMILGIAIPKMHTTWYATKIELAPVLPKDLVTPKKGKKIEGQKFRQEIAEIITRFGERSKKMQWQILL